MLRPKLVLLLTDIVQSCLSLSPSPPLCLRDTVSFILPWYQKWHGIQQYVILLDFRRKEAFFSFFIFFLPFSLSLFLFHHSFTKLFKLYKEYFQMTSMVFINQDNYEKWQTKIIYFTHTHVHTHTHTLAKYSFIKNDKIIYQLLFLPWISVIFMHSTKH